MSTDDSGIIPIKFSLAPQCKINEEAWGPYVEKILVFHSLLGVHLGGSVYNYKVLFL